MDKIYTNGKWVKTNKTLDVFSPHDESKLDDAPHATPDQVNEVIEAAHTAFQTFQYEPPKTRKKLLADWAASIRQNQDRLAKLITKEQGKTLDQALGEIDYGCSFLDWFSEEASRIYGDIIESDQPNQTIHVIKQPVGVVAAITPWNFPLAMITRKIAPAICVGCTVVIKPAEETPLVAYELMKLAHEVGFPPGVINMVTGDPSEIGKIFCSHKQIRKISFTGSTRVGKLLAEQCAPYVKKLVLELGGNAPVIVFESANIDLALEKALFVKTRNSCQACTCGNRFLVHDSIYEQFVEKFAADFTKAELGPVINKAAKERLLNLIEQTKQEGARLVSGGTKVEPTVFADVTPEMSIANQEIFGPIAPFIRFKTEEEAIEIANATPYGLAAYFFTQDYPQMMRVSRQLEAGMVGINETNMAKASAPFGGVKESGMGREGSKYGIEDYLNIKYLLNSH